jgi:hypothetical protein
MPGRPFTLADGDNPAPKGKGRPRGHSVSEKTRAVRLKLDQMLGDAHRNIAKALKKGDVPTSRWLVEHLTKEDGIRAPRDLLEPLVQALETLDDVAEVSKRAVLMAINGDMTFDQLKFVQEALARHSVLSGVVELRKLREEVQAMVDAANIAPQVLGRDHLPSWGRLAKDVTPTHAAGQKLPAE